MKYRILEVPVAGPPVVREVEDPFKAARTLFKNGYVQMAPLDDGVQLFCDEDGISKGLPFNRPVPITRTLGAVYQHEVYGPFVLGRHDFDNDVPLSLTDDDIAHYTKVLG